MLDYPWLLKEGDGDVHLAPSEQRACYRQPVFLCPQAIAAGVNVTANQIERLVASAQNHGIIPKGRSLGRQAIAHVLSCRPTLYEKLLDTCNVINWDAVTRLERDAPIKKTDLVVCAFRIRDYSRMSKALGLTDAEIAKKAKVDEALAKSLTANYRLPLEPILRVQGVLRTVALSKPDIEPEAEDMKRLRGNDVSKVILIDDRQYVNIEKLPKRDDGREEHLLNQFNVVSAPASGHPWAWT